MTNKELLEIIKIARETSVNVNVLRKVLKIVELNGEISSKKAKQIKELFKMVNMNDIELLNIFEKSYHKKINCDYMIALSKHPLIKRFLNNMNFSKEAWDKILKFVSEMQENDKIDSLYIKWLSYIYSEEEFYLSTLDLFHEVFKESLETPFINYDWYFLYLLDRKIPFNYREHVFKLLKINMLNLLKENVEIKDIEAKAQKIISCYELYRYDFANLYASVITCIVDLDIPNIDYPGERGVYTYLYKAINYVCSNDNLGSNFKNSYYYQIATNRQIYPGNRLEFIRTICNRNLVLKNDLVRELWKINTNRGQEFLIELKWAFLNNGIRTNPLCKKFLLKEKDLKVLKLARLVFRNNRVRKDKESLCALCNLKTSEEKISFLNFLKNKYQDDLEIERKREEKKKALLKAYKNFFDKKIGMGRLEECLENSQELNINVVRVRRDKNNGRKI